MCRLFGLLAAAAERPSPWLVDAEIPLLRQANIDPGTLQAEGWGIGWYEGRTGKRARVERAAEAVYLPAQREKFTQVATSVVSPLVLAHLRKASNPMHLPREQLLGPENTQPFLSDGSLFAHNGWIALPHETRPRLGTRARKLRGVNDSEVLQQLFLKHLDTLDDPLRAYAQSMRTLHEVWEGQGRPTPGPHGGLNLLFSRSPEELWAFCHFTGEHGSCLSGLPRPYYEMSYVAAPERLVVASEPTDRHLERWTPLRSGHYLHARNVGGRVLTTVGEVPGLPAFPASARAGAMASVPTLPSA